MPDIVGGALRVSDEQKVPITADTTPLILVRKDGTIICANSMRDKERLVFDPENEGGAFLAPWPGKFRTDVFLMSHDFLKAVRW